MIRKESSMNKKVALYRACVNCGNICGENIDAILKNPSITQKELENLTGLTRRGVEWNLARLKEEGMIKRISPAKGEKWEAVNGD